MAVSEVLVISTILATAQCGFLFNDSPSQIQQHFRPSPPPPAPFFQQMRAPNFNNPPPPPPPPDVRSFLSHLPIISNLIRGSNLSQREMVNSEPQFINNAPRFDTKLQMKPYFEQSSPAAMYDEGHKTVNENDLSDISSVIDVTNNSILDEEITSTTEDYETTTDYDLFSRMGPPPAVVASLLG